MFRLNEIRSLRYSSVSRHSEEIAVSVLIPAFRCAEVLGGTVQQLHDCLRLICPGDFEIILIPNGSVDKTYEIAEQLAFRYPMDLKVVRHVEPRGKGAALRTGFNHCRGSFIYLIDADLPYDVAFILESLKLLKQGFDLVTANRRHRASRFNLPASLMQSAFLRHCLSLFFNSIVRLLLRIDTVDTQAGMKAMSRRFAEAAFSNQTCPGFFYDLELFLCCRVNNFKSTELPVVLYLSEEKSTVQLLRDGLLALIWIFRIYLKMKKGNYVIQTKEQTAIEPKIFATRMSE
jgi:glycosyltransferase involved in cell wall biosynthesis